MRLAWMLQWCQLYKSWMALSHEKKGKERHWRQEFSYQWGTSWLTIRLWLTANDITCNSRKPWDVATWVTGSKKLDRSNLNVTDGHLLCKFGAKLIVLWVQLTNKDQSLCVLLLAKKMYVFWLLFSWCCTVATKPTDCCSDKVTAAAVKTVVWSSIDHYCVCLFLSAVH